MNKDLVDKYRNVELDLCCSETIFYAANEKYALGLDKQHFRIAASFCGGNLRKDNCGLVTASIAILGIVFAEDVSHKSPLLKEAVNYYQDRFIEELATINCQSLIDKYRDSVTGCNKIIYIAFDLLEETIEEHKKRL